MAFQYRLMLSMLWPKILFGMVIFVVVVGSGVCYYKHLQKNQEELERAQETEAESMIPEDFNESTSSIELGGFLFATLVSPSDMSTPVLVDVSKDSISQFPLETIATSDAVSSQYSFSTNYSFGTFLALTEETSERDIIPVSYDVYVAEFPNTTDANAVIEGLKNAHPVSWYTKKDYYRINPVISNTRGVLYSSLSKTVYENNTDSLGDTSAEDWNIYYTDALSTSTVLTRGLYPRWVNDTQFAYLKNDGVYFYDMDSGSTNLVWKSPRSITKLNGFDVSGDGDFLVFTDIREGELIVTEVFDWSTGDFAPLQRVTDVNAYSPIISPENAYVALLTKTINQEEGVETAIEYYAIADMELELDHGIIFDDKDIDFISLTDW